MEELRSKRRPCERLVGQQASAVQASQGEDDALEIGFIEDLLPFGSTEQKRIAAKVVDPIDHALGAIIGAAEEAVAEDAILEASHVRIAIDVPNRLLKIEDMR